MFYSIVLEKDKTFPCLHKSKREAILCWKVCSRKVFKVIEIEMFEQEIPIFHKHLNSSKKKTFKVKSFSKEGSLNFLEFIIIEKSGGHHAIFRVLEVKRLKILQNWAYKMAFVCILCFIFYGVSCAKTNLHNKYMI